MRYTAYTLDGSPIFRAASAQELADRVFTHMQESRRPHIGYTYDEWYHGNYMTWQLRDHLEGYPHKNFSEVADWWKGRHTSNARVWKDGPPPSVGWWNASIRKSPTLGAGGMVPDGVYLLIPKTRSGRLTRAQRRSETL